MLMINRAFYDNCSFFNKVKLFKYLSIDFLCSGFWLVLANKMPLQRQEGKRTMGLGHFFSTCFPALNLVISLCKIKVPARQLPPYSSLLGF